MLVSGVPALCGAQTLAVQPVVSERPAPEAMLVAPVQDMQPVQVSSRFVQSKQQAGKLKVLSSEVIADGVERQMVQNERGIIYKRYLKDGKPLGQVNLARKAPQLKAEGDEVPVALWEDFEGYTGDGYDDWLPEGWTEIAAEGNVPVDSVQYKGEWLYTSYNNTWRVTPTDTWGFLPMTSDGMMEAGVHFSYDYTMQYNDTTYTEGEGGKIDTVVTPKVDVLIPVVAQDEWLITPAVDIAEYQNLYFNLAFDCSMTYYLDWDWFEYDLDSLTSNFEVLVKETGTEEWTKLYDNERDYVSQFDSIDIYDIPFEYRQVGVDLSAYVGKNIQIAFRYISEPDGGNTMMIDAVKVGPRTLEALYDRPAGDFFVGYSSDYLSIGPDALFGPAYADRVFTNQGAADDINYVWEYTINEDGETATATTSDLTVNLPWGMTTPPVLTASAEGATSVSYQWGDWGTEYDAPIMFNGGSTVVGDGQGGMVTLGVGNYDRSYGLGAFNFADGAYCFGTGSDSYYYGDTVVAIGNYFEKPTQPYVLNGLTIGLGVLDADDDAEFPIYILEYDEYGYATGDTLAQATCTAGDALAVDVGGGTTWYSLVYDQLMQKDEDGFVSDLPNGLLVSTPIMIKMDGIHSPKVHAFAPLSQGYSTPSEENNAAVYFRAEDYWSGEVVTRVEWAEDVLQSVYTSHMFSLDAAYPFLHADDTRYDAPVAGGTKRFEVMSYYVTDAWSIAEELPDWLAVEFAEGDEWGQLSVTVQPLGDAPKRECTFTLEAVNSPSIQFTVSQDPDYSGVQAVEDASYKVETLPDAWNVLYPASARQLTVIDMNGRLISEYELSESALVLPTNDLSAGVYFLRFNDGKVLKAVK